MKYNYTQIANNQEPNKPILRPYIGVRIIHQNKHKDLVALIDSGADVSLAHADIGTLLGVDVPAGRPWSYRGSVNTQVGLAYIHNLHLILINFSSLDLDIAFTDQIPPGTFLLGQRHFFETYQVRFDLSKRIFEVLELPRPTAVRIH